MSSPQTASSSALRGYIPTLDGWRCIAILGVILYHGSSHLPGRAANLALTYGANGVDLFFALSGFLITTRLTGEERETGRISLKGFYTRRLFRLQPAALAYLAVIALCSFAGLIPVVWGSWTAAIFACYSFTPAHNDYTHWFTNHFWSLSAEEQFYLVFPSLLLLVRKRRLLALCLAAIVLEIWFLLVLRHPHLFFMGQMWHRTDMVINCIVLGCIAALLLQHASVKQALERWLHPWAGMLIAATLWIASTHMGNGAHLAKLTVYPVLILSTALHPRSWLSLLLESKPFRFVGRISYSLYLWQQFFFTLEFSPAPGDFRSNAWFCWIGTFLVATASYFLLEKPSIRFGHRLALRWTSAPSEKARPEPRQA
jgi:peptidoglycan/LPS O-acetylase OafA/YrhL